MSVWELLVYLLAVTRLTGLIVEDEITDTPRQAILRHLSETKPTHVALAYLITCHWCVSLWVATVTALTVWAVGTPDWITVCGLALAGSQVAGMLATTGRHTTGRH